MADDTQTAAPPQDDAIAQALRLAQILQGQQQQPTAPQQQDRSFVSLLGSALGSGSTAPTVDEEDAGRRALMSFGINMLQAGGPSLVKRSFGQALAQGLSGAGESELQSQQLAAARLGAQQDYQQKQQEMRLNAIKEAIPLLTMAQQRKMMGLPNPLAGGGGTPSIGAAGGPDPVAGLPKDQALAAIAQRESGNQNIFSNIKVEGYSQDQLGSGYYQIIPSTWREGAKLAGVDTTKYPLAINAPREVQDKVAGVLWDKYGAKPWAQSAPRAAPGGTGTATAATPPPATPTPPAASTAPVRTTPPPGVIQTDQPAGGATVAGPPGTAIVGAAKPPGPAVGGDVNAMIRGMIGAGANATTLAPGAATSGPAAPPAVVAAATPQGATPPAATTTPPATPTPQMTTQQATPDTRPDVELTPGEYLQRHIQPVTVPTVTVTQDAMQRAQQVMADAAKSKSAAAQALGLALTDETRIKAGDAYTKANADWQNANQAVSTLQQQAAIETAKAQAKAEEDQRQRLTTTYNQIQAQKAETDRQTATLGATATENEKNRQAEIAKINAQAGATERTAALNPINTESAAAAHRLDDLQVLKGFSNNLGDPTFLTSYKVGGQSLADIISGAGLGSQALQDKAGQAQAFRAVALSIVRDLRLGGAATGEPRSNQDLQFITSMVPSEMQSPATRNAIISYIEQINQRRMEYGAEVGRLVTTPQYSNNVGGAILAARQAMPDMLQTVPKELAYGGGDVGQKRLDWFREKVQPGTFYRAPNGRMQVWNGVKGDPDYIP